MKLSELHTGSNAYIVKVLGHGGFRKRIVEMGFVRGQQVEVLLNAPLQDPVKYRVMGYEVSLRRSEAAMIEVTHEAHEPKPAMSTAAAAHATERNTDNAAVAMVSTSAEVTTDHGKPSPYRTINVALVGNPNCGKTSLFNFVSGAHERVGNYSGVTVDAKQGHADFEGYRFNIVDLPGTYSLSAYSPEERYVRHELSEHTPDVVLNVIDTGNIERNLFLTTQLIDMHLRMVCALNMFDEAEQRGDHINVEQLSQLFGVPMQPTVFTKGKGVKELFRNIIKVYEQQEDTLPEYRHIHIDNGHEVEDGISAIQDLLKQESDLRTRFSTRFLAIKVLEGDSEVTKMVASLPCAKAVEQAREKANQRIEEEMHTTAETVIMDAKYGFISGALKESGYSIGSNDDHYRTTHWLDRLVTHKWLGFPVFILLLFLMFEATFRLGQYPADWIEAGFGWLGEWLQSVMPASTLRDMLVDGIVAGVGAVIVFLPQILILYTFISFMEDSGYMARAAFIMDKLMHMMGLHGKSFIPLVMGFGCNVPAIMATRTIESRRARLVTMLILPLMSCSARLPIYIMIVGTFFAVGMRAPILISLYVIGIVLAVVMSRLFSRFLVKGDDTPFVMELPPYRMPTRKAIVRHTWEKGKQYLKKMGTIILVASVAVWMLGYFPHDDSLPRQQQQEQSYIGRIGKAVEPIFRPQGFNWKLDVGLISGVGAKEIVASTMGVLYVDDESYADDEDFGEEDNDKYSRLYRQMSREGITPLAAFCFLLFVLIYFPCIATIAAIRSETGSWRWALFVALYTTVLAWIVSAAVYQIGSILQ